MRFIEIQLQDFKGLTTTIGLSGPATILIGYNGAGKTTVLEGFYIGLTGMLPGHRPSQMDAATMQTLAGPSRRWGVVIRDDEGGEVRREFLGIQSRVRANFGENSTSSKNEDHDQAIKDRYGDFVASLDLSSLLSMRPDDLRDFVLDLCARGGGASPWTMEQVIEDLRSNVPDIDDEPDIVEIPEDCEGPLPLLGLLDTRISEAKTDCRRGVIEANRIRHAEIPELPDPVELEQAEKEVSLVESELASGQEELGRIDARGAERESIEQDIEERRDSIEKAKKKTREVRAEIDEALNLKEGFEHDIGLLKDDVEMLEADGLGIDAPEALEDQGGFGVLEKMIEAIGKKLSTAREKYAVENNRAEDLNERLSQYKDGVCPECGQAAPDLVGSLTQKKAKMEKARDKKKAAVKKLTDQHYKVRTELKEKTDEAQAHGKATREAAAALQTWEKKVEEKKHAIELLIEKQTANDDKGIRLEGRVEELMTDIASQTRGLKKARKKLDEMSKPGAELKKLNGFISGRKERLAEYRQVAEELRAEERQARKAIKARDVAEDEHNAYQEWRKTLNDAEAALICIRREVVSSYVEPVVSRVTDVIGDYLGTFEARFEPRFQLGFSRDTGSEDEAAWVPLHRLSTGEFAMAALALGYALCDLRDPPVKVLMMDKIEVLDPINLKPFIETVSNMVASEVLDQVLVAGMGTRPAYTVTGADDVTVISMHEVTKAAAEAA